MCVSECYLHMEMYSDGIGPIGLEVRDRESRAPVRVGEKGGLGQNEGVDHQRGRLLLTSGEGMPGMGWARLGRCILDARRNRLGQGDRGFQRTSP